MNKPVLFCYDGSEGSKTALHAAAELIKPGDAVVLAVWTTVAVQLARTGSFLVAIPNEGEIDEDARFVEGTELAKIPVCKVGEVPNWPEPWRPRYLPAWREGRGARGND